MKEKKEKSVDPNHTINKHTTAAFGDEAAVVLTADAASAMDVAVIKLE